MRRLRIGTDRVIVWSITSGGKPYDLTGKDITLKVSAPGCSFSVTEGLAIDGNILKWHFRGKDQTRLGPYTLTLIENNGKTGMVSFDKCDAFAFVDCSCKESGTDEADLSMDGVEVSSDLVAAGIIELDCFFEITYSKLVYLRDSGQLTPGRFYRITDYDTITAQENTQSAGHPFDVIVLAMSNNELSEDAWAGKSERDAIGHFANSNLSAWKIRYRLDNDTSRFSWADARNGKGIICGMIDEFGNDCPYDFKNIQYFSEADNRYFYTFSAIADGEIVDSSMVHTTNSNKIRSVSNTAHRQLLNNIVFRNDAISDVCERNEFGGECYDMTFGSNCTHNQVGALCHDLNFGKQFKYNVIGSSSANLTFGRFCQNNTIADLCSSITAGDSCRYLVFGKGCSNITMLTNYRYIEFGVGCTAIDFSNAGNYVWYCKFNPGVNRVTIYNEETASSNVKLKYFTLLMGDDARALSLRRNEFAEQFIGFDGYNEYGIINPMDA